MTVAESRQTFNVEMILNDLEKMSYFWVPINDLPFNYLKLQIPLIPPIQGIRTFSCSSILFSYVWMHAKCIAMLALKLITSKTRFYKLPARGLANKIWFFKNKKDQEIKKNSRKFHFLSKIIQKVTDNSDSHSLLQQRNNNWFWNSSQKLLG